MSKHKKTEEVDRLTGKAKVEIHGQNLDEKSFQSFKRPPVKIISNQTRSKPDA
jgi:hypothetical protein